MDRKILVVSPVAYLVTLCTVPGDVLRGVPGILAFGLFPHGFPGCRPSSGNRSFDQPVHVRYLYRATWVAEIQISSRISVGSPVQGWITMLSRFIRNVVSLILFPAILGFAAGYRVIGIPATYHWGEFDAKPTQAVTETQFLISRLFPIAIGALVVILLELYF
jgi:hypothetical protein